MAAPVLIVEDISYQYESYMILTTVPLHDPKPQGGDAILWTLEVLYSKHNFVGEMQS